MAESENQPHTIGRYEVLRLLGAGAMGSVFLAEDPRIKRKVAIKTVKMDAIRHEQDRHEFMARFQREAEVSGLLNHPGIVAIYDVGESDQGPFLAMEFVAGKPLDALIKAGAPLSLGQRLRIAAAIAEALDHAHARGIIHRDVKPGNVMVGEDGRPKLMDFGIAKREDASLTQTGTFLGTPSYASPEQIKDGTVDNRSDIFSFGVMVFELISGQSPFPGNSINTILYKIVNEPPVDLQPPVTGMLPEGWKRVFDKVLSKRPQDRHSSCSAFIRDLVDAVADGEQVNRRELMGILRQGGEGPLPEIVSRAHDETMVVPQAARGGAGRWVGLGLGAVAAVGLGLWIALGSGGKDVLVKSRPEGATVYINGKKQELFASNNFRLREGDVIRLEARGYKPSQDIRYTKSEVFPPEIPLAPIVSRVELVSEPEGAVVVLDSRELGPAPQVVEAWNQGEAHDLTLTKGDLMYTRKFLAGEVPAGVLKLEKRASAATVEPPLDPHAKGYLVVKGGFSVSVRVDGADRGQLSPGAKLELEPGPHKVELAHPKVFYKDTRTVTITAGQGSAITLPGTATLTVETFPGTGRVFIDGLDAGIESDLSPVTVAHGTHTITVKGPKASKTVTESIGGDRALKFQL